MKGVKKIFCRREVIEYVLEKQLLSGYTISMVEVYKGNFGRYVLLELMIFFQKSKSSNEYEVRVYKYSKNGEYVPSALDRVDRYEENDKYISFFFDNFEAGHNFVIFLFKNHPEYKTRPLIFAKTVTHFPFLS